MAGRVRHLLMLVPLVLIGCAGGASKNGWSITGNGVEVDRHAKRLEVRPQETTLPVGKQLVMLATVYDDDNKPRKKRRVEWKVEGPGVIYEVDDGGILQGRGFKEDSKSAISFTDTSERNLPTNIDNPMGQVARPGQTWCALSSAVEGQTVVHVYAPEIGDSENNRVMIKVNWVDARWQFPEPSTARAGTELMLQTRITRHSDKQAAPNYRVRYSLITEGPPATLAVATDRTATQVARELIVPCDTDGLARAIIKELQPDFGNSQVGIEILRPDSNQPGGFAVVARSQTKVEWQAPQLSINIEAPKTAQINQAVPITYSVASTGTLETSPMMVRATVPEGVEIVSATPKATVDGREFLWSLPALPGGKQHTMQVIYKPTQTGNFNLAANARTSDNLKAENSFTVQAIEARLQISLSGPNTALVGESLPYQIVVKNAGSGAAQNVRVTAQFDAGLEVGGQPGPLNTTIDKLESGQEKTIPLALSPKQAGKSAVKAIVVADGNMQAETPASGIDVKKPEVKVEVYGPSRGYLNQEITWTVRVFNPSDVSIGNLVVRAALPPDFTFRSATNEGRLVSGAVEWNLGTAVGKQWADLQVTGVATRLGKSVLTAQVAGAPIDQRNGEFKTVSMAKPFTSEKVEGAIEILGVPALQLEVFDSADPVQVGQTVTYTVRIKNTGTLPANQIELTAELPPQMKALRAFGATNGKIDGQRIVFPPLETLRPNLLNVFTIEAQATSEGDGRFRAEVKSLSLGSPLRAEEATRIVPKR